MNLQKQSKLSYTVRLKIEGATSPSQIPSVEQSQYGDLYVKVTLTHKTGDPTYGFVKVTDSMKTTVDNNVYNFLSTSCHK